MATTQQRLMTADEFAHLADDDIRRDLLDGKVIELPPTNFEHGRMANDLAYFLTDFVRRNHLGQVLAAETGFRLSRDPDTVLAPDAAFVRAERVPALADRRRFADLAPDLVVEVVSPSERSDDVQAKVLTYLAAGVRMVWVAHPQQQTVTVYTFDGTARIVRPADTLDGGDVLPGFTLPLAELFEASDR